MVTRIGSDESEFLQGTPESDIIFGNGGDDLLFGGDGDDILHDGLGLDILLGGDGNDTFKVIDNNQFNLSSAFFNPTEVFPLDGGDGIDTIDATDAIESIELAASIFAFASVESVIGSRFDDLIEATSTPFSVLLMGGAGNDVLKGGVDDDTLIGGDGDDFLEGSIGSDILSGGRNVAPEIVLSEDSIPEDSVLEDSTPESSVPEAGPLEDDPSSFGENTSFNEDASSSITTSPEQALLSRAEFVCHAVVAFGAIAIEDELVPVPNDALQHGPQELTREPAELSAIEDETPSDEIFSTVQALSLPDGESTTSVETLSVESELLSDESEIENREVVAQSDEEETIEESLFATEEIDSTVEVPIEGSVTIPPIALIAEETTEPDIDDLQDDLAPLPEMTSNSDTFFYAELDHSRLSGFDVITDLEIGVDIIDTPNPLAADSVLHLGDVEALDSLSIAVILTDDVFTPLGAATFTWNERTFLALNDDIAGFQAASDAVIEITGYAGELTALAIV